MPITPKHAFKEKSIKLLILLPLRTIYNRTYQCETPCTTNYIPHCLDLDLNDQVMGANSDVGFIFKKNRL